MKDKIGKIGRLLLGAVFILTFFSSIRIIAIYYYHLQAAKGNQTLAMTLMDKASSFNLISYLTGGLHFSVVIIMLMIILDK